MKKLTNNVLTIALFTAFILVCNSLFQCNVFIKSTTHPGYDYATSVNLSDLGAVVHAQDKRVLVQTRVKDTSIFLPDVKF